MIPQTTVLRRRRRLEAGINLAPLLDVVLNLIFFFLLATSLRREDVALEVNLPASGSATATLAENIPTITVDAAGNFHFDGRRVLAPELEIELAGLARGGMNGINIRGDEGADFGRVFELWEICRRAGLKNVMTNARRDTPEAAAGRGGR